MRSGSLRHDITLDTVTGQTADIYGGYTDDYTDLAPATEYAAIEPATASRMERLVGNTIEAKISHILTMRYRSDINTTTRITFNGRIFMVRGVQNVDERGIELRVFADEVIS